MKNNNRWIMGSALGIAAFAIAIDHTRHPVPIPESAVIDHISIINNSEDNPCSLDSSPCSLSDSPCSVYDSNDSPCSIDYSESPCAMDSPCALNESPCGLDEGSPCSL